MNRTSSTGVVCALLAASACLGQTLDIPRYTIDGGGGLLLGGTFSLTGTIGQHDANPPLTAGSFTLTGGFWAAPAINPCPADFNADTFVDDSDFVIFASCYEAFIAEGPCVVADFNADGFVDDSDFVEFAAAYEAFVCP